MNNPCGCQDVELTNSLMQDQIATCPAVVHETVCVQAEVTIIPDVDVGEVRSFCVGNPFIGTCRGTPARSCTFNVSQRICVQVPLTFKANASARPDGIVCGTPQTGPCPGTTACTRTIGFYRNNPEVTNALITNAGGSIILGNDAQGASFTVTTANANDVFDFDVTSPPAPSDPPFAQQYQVLYAQLLAAKLNVLSGATCDFATMAIATADNFLAASPAGTGMLGHLTFKNLLLSSMKVMPRDVQVTAHRHRRNGFYQESRSLEELNYNEKDCRVS